MTLLAPGAAWLLLLLPFLVLLYFLKLRRPRLRIPSTLLWRRMLQDSRVNTPFQRLRRSLLLLLQVACLILLAIAAARPLQMLKTQPRESILVLIDQSASMQAKSANGDRFSEARRELLRLVDNLGPRSEMAIAGYANRTSVLQTFTNDRRQLAKIAGKLTPTDAPDNPTAALELAASLIIARPQSRVVLISDSLPASSGAPLPFELEFLKIGEPAPNLAITGGDLRRRPDDPRQVEVHLTIRRYGNLPAPLVRLLVNDQQLAARVPTFDQGGMATLIFDLPLPTAAIIEARLEGNDALAVDDVAWLSVPPPQELQIAISGPEAATRYFKTAIAAMPFVSVADTPTNADATIAVVDSLPEPPPVGIELLVLQPPAEAPVPNGVIDWQADAPLCRFADFRDLRVSRVALADFPKSYRTLATAGNLPLLAELRAGQNHRTVINFIPDQSNWPLLASFPLFLHNWINWLHHLSPEATVGRLRVGQRQAVAVAPAGTVVNISGPAIAPRASIVANRVYASGLDKAGVYELSIGRQTTRPLAVNLFDADESNLDRRQAKTHANVPPVTTVAPRIPASREWTLPCVALALLLLCVEWSVHHRLWGRSHLPQRQVS